MQFHTISFFILKTPFAKHLTNMFMHLPGHGCIKYFPPDGTEVGRLRRVNV